MVLHDKIQKLAAAISRTGRGVWGLFSLVILVLGGCGAGALRSSLTENPPAAPAATESPRLDLKVAWVQASPPARKKGGGSRDPGFCPITPYPQNSLPLVWSDRPSLIWATQIPGTLSRVGVRLQANKQVVWSQPVNSTATLVQVDYAGQTLEPGQSYEWVSYNLTNQEDTVVPFRILMAEENQRVGNALATLEAGWKAKGATAEGIAQAKAKYFAEQQLWSDMVQMAFSVQNPSAELKTFRNKLVNQVCRQPG